MGTFLDCIFPTEEKPTADEAAALKAREANQLKTIENSTVPKKFADAYDTLLEDDNERLKSVETRLGSLLGLTSVTATLLIGGMLALVNGSLGDSSRAVRAVAAIGAFYLSLQIICATLASIRGLGRATWVRPGVEDLVPDLQSGSTLIARERAVGTCKRYHATDRNVNFKVTQMAIGHIAIRNFAVASVTIAMLGLFAILLQTPGNSAAKAIRKDAELQKLLRGPQGPPGPPAVSVPATALTPKQNEPGLADHGKVRSKIADPEHNPIKKQ